MTTPFSRLGALRRVAAVVLLGALVALGVAVAESPAAAAEPTLADVETARAMYVEGFELRDANRLADSLTRFRAAYALAATPITALELGRAHMLVGELLEARALLLSIERIAPKPEDSQKAASARVEARALAEQIRGRIPSVHVSVTPKPEGEPKVTIDGEVVPAEALGAARRLNPGKHVVAAELGDARASVEVELGESEARPVVLALGPEASGARGGVSGRDVWFWSGLGVGAAGIAAGSVTGILAFTSADGLNSQCTGNHCARAAQGDIDRSRAFAAASTVAFVVAGVGLTAMLLEVLTRPDVRRTSVGLSF